MPRRETFSKSESELALPFTRYDNNLSVFGVAIDLQNADSILFLIESAGVIDGTHAFTFEESIDLAFTVPIAIPESDLRGASLADLTFTGPDDNIAKQVSVVNNKRFIRIVITTSGASGGGGGLFASAAVKQLLTLAPII